MAKALIDNFTKEQLKELVNSCTSMKELSRKIGYNSIGNNNKTIQNRLNKYNIFTEHFTGLPKGYEKRNVDNIFIKDPKASQSILRNWYKKGNYSEYKCSICGLEPFWNGKELTLTLDHINGINHDDRLENLRWICPNCDRQLPTFGSKNPNSKQHKEDNHFYCIDCGIEISRGAKRCKKCNNKFTQSDNKPSKEELLFKLLLDCHENFAQISRDYKVSRTTVRRWCKNYGLPDQSKYYKGELNET